MKKPVKLTRKDLVAVILETKYAQEQKWTEGFLDGNFDDQDLIDIYQKVQEDPCEIVIKETKSRFSTEEAWGYV